MSGPRARTPVDERLQALAELSRGFERQAVQVDMSPHAVTRRLVELAEVSALCLALGRIQARQSSQEPPVAR